MNPSPAWLYLPRVKRSELSSEDRLQAARADRKVYLGSHEPVPIPK